MIHRLGNGPTPPNPARELDRQRLRKLKADAVRAELEIRVRRGELRDRRQGLDAVFRFGCMLRDHWQAWPVKVGRLLAAQLGVDPHAVVVALEEALRFHQPTSRPLTSAATR